MVTKPAPKSKGDKNISEHNKLLINYPLPNLEKLDECGISLNFNNNYTKIVPTSNRNVSICNVIITSLNVDGPKPTNTLYNYFLKSNKKSA